MGHSREGGFLRALSRRPVSLTSGPMNFFDPISSRDGRELFAVGVQPRAEVIRYDLSTRRFTSFLSGISAEGLDFSRDGAWITYTSYPEGTLWRSRINGSDRLQLTFPPMRVLLPRWSPDRKQIAFMGSPPSGPWKMGRSLEDLPYLTRWWHTSTVACQASRTKQIRPGRLTETLSPSDDYPGLNALTKIPMV